MSVKENAHVFINGSPDKIFVDVPKGLIGRALRANDWFVTTAKNELDEYYECCVEQLNLQQRYSSVVDLYSNTNVKERKRFGEMVKTLHDSNNSVILYKYKQLCTKVGLKSAELFNENLVRKKNHLSPIFHFFFKINGVRYFLAGTEGLKPFAVLLPSSEEWMKSYEFLSIYAEYKDAGQPEVILTCLFKDKNSKNEFSLDIRIEIRWSHGKFCGNPEAKVYKQWKYQDLP